MMHSMPVPSGAGIVILFRLHAHDIALKIVA